MKLTKMVLKKVFQVPFVIRIFILVLLSRYFQGNLFKKISKTLKNSKSEILKKIPKAGRPKYWLPGLILGNFADIKPWDCKEGFIVAILGAKKHWYNSVKEGFNLRIVQVKMFTSNFIFTNDLDLILSFHGKEDRLFRNSDSIRKSIAPLFPESITVLTGDQWKRVRRVFVSAVNKLDYEVLPPVTNDVLKDGIKNYVHSDVQEIFLRDFYARIVFDSFHKFAFDVNFGTISGKNLDLLDNLRIIATNISNRMIISIPFIWNLPTKSNRDLWRARKAFLDFLDVYITERKAKLLKDYKENNERKFTNLLDAFIWAREEDKNKTNCKKYLTKSELKSQMFAAMIGAFDTTSSTMSLQTVNLMRNPQIQERLYEEIKDIDLSNVTQTELDNCKYLNACISETLRFNTPSPGCVRTPNQDVVVKGFKFKKDTTIICDHETLGRRPEYWGGQTDLDVYRPGRWLEVTPTKGAYFPFGFGGRMCIGQKVAKSQLMIMTCFMVQNFKIGASKRPVKIASSLGRSLSKDTSVIFYRRK